MTLPNETYRTHSACSFSVFDELYKCTLFSRYKERERCIVWCAACKTISFTSDVTTICLSMRARWLRCSSKQFITAHTNILTLSQPSFSRHGVLFRFLIQFPDQNQVPYTSVLYNSTYPRSIRLSDTVHSNHVYSFALFQQLSGTMCQRDFAERVLVFKGTVLSYGAILKTFRLVHTFPITQPSCVSLCLRQNTSTTIQSDMIP